MTLAISTAPPGDIDELLLRAEQLAGRTLGEVAELVGVEVPRDLRRAKGWVGQLLETCLGASAGNLPVPDFQALGVELKTIPTDVSGKPRESTYVCTVPLTDVDDADWESSTVRLKLGAVLWIPILSDRDLPLAARIVGRPFLWRPDEKEEAALRRDWEDHLRVIRDGYVDNIRGADGDVHLWNLPSTRLVGGGGRRRLDRPAPQILRITVHSRCAPLRRHLRQLRGQAARPRAGHPGAAR